MKFEPIQITRHDVLNGFRNNCKDCPAAMAVRRHFGAFQKHGEIVEVEIDLYTVTVHIGHLRLEFYTPLKLRRWINRFDFTTACRTQFPLCNFNLWYLDGFTEYDVTYND